MPDTTTTVMHTASSTPSCTVYSDDTSASSPLLFVTAPFVARENPDYPAYDTYDQLMRLEEWLPRMDDDDGEGDPR